jgi:DNA-binding CsgD family transcriptional regulator
MSETREQELARLIAEQAADDTHMIRHRAGGTIRVGGSWAVSLPEEQAYEGPRSGGLANPFQNASAIWKPREGTADDRLLLDDLTEAEQVLLNLRYAECLTLREIGAELGIGKDTVTRDLAKVHEKVRARLIVT